MKRKRHGTQKDSSNNYTFENQPRCTICLQGFTNRTFVRDCFHSFCFVCIRQWINVTPDCPLCKGTIQALIYNIVEDLNTYQEYRLADKKPNATKHHPSSSSVIDRRKPTRPWLKRRRALYRYLPSVLSYPPPQPSLSSLSIIQPDHMPKIIPFLQSELQAILGTAYDPFIETHLQTILLIPYHSNKKSTDAMTMYDILDQVSDWLNENDRVSRRLMDELLAFLKSGVNYMTFINTANYEPMEHPLLDDDDNDNATVDSSGDSDHDRTLDRAHDS